MIIKNTGKNTNMDINVCTAHYAFIADFRKFFPNLQLVPSIASEAFKTEVIQKSDLVIFPGGSDISPSIYGEENTHSYPNSVRDKIEISVLETAIRLNKKILGVCRGHQLINAYLGGKLVQDLEIDLNASHDSYHYLTVHNSDSGMMTNIFSKGVNSLHHQGVIKPGKDLIPTSFHKGVIESIESVNKKIISVQFHPEFMNIDCGYNFFEYIAKWTIGNEQ